MTRPIPLEQALAALDTPEAVADRRKRAQKLAAEMAAESGPGPRSIALDPYAAATFAAGSVEMQKALKPMRRFGPFDQPTESEKRAAAAEADRNVMALVARQIEVALRAADEREVREAPDRMAEAAIWRSYSTGVAAIAWSCGDKEPEFLRKWKALIAERNDAEEFGTDADVRSVDAKLLRFVGIPYPAATPAAPPATNGNGNGNTRRTRKSALHTTR